MKKPLVLLVILLLGIVNAATAQTAPPHQPAPQWWFTSALADTTNRWLFHAEGQYSYSKMTGATDGETQSGGARVAIRKSIFTHQSVYKIDKMNMALKSLGMSYSTESQVFSDYLDVDITPLVYGEAGFIWERDNTILLKNRYTGYGGVGVNGVLFEKHSVNMLAAVGRVTQNYIIPVEQINVVKGAYDVFYLRQAYQFSLAPRLSFTEQAMYQVNLNDTERYRVSVGLNLAVAIAEPLSLVLGYSYKYDKEIAMVGSFAENTTENIGFKISF